MHQYLCKLRLCTLSGRTLPHWVGSVCL